MTGQDTRKQVLRNKITEELRDKSETSQDRSPSAAH